MHALSIFYSTGQEYKFVAWPHSIDRVGEGYTLLIHSHVHFTSNFGSHTLHRYTHIDSVTTVFLYTLSCYAVVYIRYIAAPACPRLCYSDVQYSIGMDGWARVRRPPSKVQPTEII